MCVLVTLRKLYLGAIRGSFRRALLIHATLRNTHKTARLDRKRDLRLIFYCRKELAAAEQSPSSLDTKSWWNQRDHRRRTWFRTILSDIPLVHSRLRMIGLLKDQGIFLKECWEKNPEFANMSSDSLKHPVAYYSRSTGNPRIATQKGCFTVHGTDSQPIEAIMTTLGKTKWLIKCRVQPKFAASIRDNLRILGITPRAVFPDLYGLAQELQTQDFMRPMSGDLSPNNNPK